MEIMNNNLEEKIKELKKGYIIKLKGILAELKTLLNADKIAIDEVYPKVHTISGTSGMYGISDLSNASTEFEFYLKPLKENPSSINANEFHSKFSDYLCFLEETISTGE